MGIGPRPRSAQHPTESSHGLNRPLRPPPPFLTITETLVCVVADSGPPHLDLSSAGAENGPTLGHPKTRSHSRTSAPGTPEPERRVQPSAAGLAVWSQTRGVTLGDFLFQVLKQGDDILSGSVASSARRADLRRDWFSEPPWSYFSQETPLLGCQRGKPSHQQCKSKQPPAY